MKSHLSSLVLIIPIIVGGLNINPYFKPLFLSSRSSSSTLGDTPVGLMRGGGGGVLCFSSSSYHPRTSTSNIIGTSTTRRNTTSSSIAKNKTSWWRCTATTTRGGKTTKIKTEIFTRRRTSAVGGGSGSSGGMDSHSFFSKGFSIPSPPPLAHSTISTTTPMNTLTTSNSSMLAMNQDTTNYARSASDDNRRRGTGRGSSTYCPNIIDSTCSNSSAASSFTFASYLASMPTLLDAHCGIEKIQTTRSSRNTVRRDTSSSSSGGGIDNVDNDLLFRITIGNEAGDADSIISSLALSYIDNIHGCSNNMQDVVEQAHTTSTTNDGVSKKKIISVPLVSVPRVDFPLRRDVVLLLEMAGVNCDKLLYLYDEVVTNIMEDPSIGKEWILVDHNKFRSDLGDLMDDAAVVEILDHHQDEGAHECVQGDRRNIAFENQCALVGSTCTLVTERLMKRYVSEDDADCRIDAGLGLALLGVILLDTMNMSVEAAKGTARDKAAIDFLLERTNWNALGAMRKELNDAIFDNTSGGSPSPSRLYEFLQNCKFDPEFWQSMSPRDTLRIDYKRFESQSSSSSSFGLSSVLLDMKSLLAKANFYTDAMDYMQEVNVTLLGVLTMTLVNDKPQREMLLIGEKQRVHEMADYLLYKDAAQSLQISKVSNDAGVILADGAFAAIHLQQGNPKGSRKQVAPVMLAMYCNE